MTVVLFLVLLFASWFVAGGSSSPTAHLMRRALPDPGPGPRQMSSGDMPGESGAVDDGALLLELAGVLLESGLSVERSLDVLANCADPVIAAQLRRVVAGLTLGAGWEEAWRSAVVPAARPGMTGASIRPRGFAARIFRPAEPGIHPALNAVKHSLGFAALSGAPSAEALRAGAATERRKAFREAERRAAALGVRLVLPLGLCSLPSFVCLGIVPVVLALLPGVA